MQSGRFPSETLHVESRSDPAAAFQFFRVDTGTVPNNLSPAIKFKSRLVGSPAE